MVIEQISKKLVKNYKTDGTLDFFSNSEILSSNCKVNAISSRPSRRIFFLNGSISNGIVSDSGVN